MTFAEATNVIENVFQTMLGTTVAAAPEAGLTFDLPLTAAVYYVGGWNGALILECSLAQATAWASLLMPLGGEPATRDDAQDSLGELTNMIAGNLKPLLSPAVSLTMPSVIEGADHKLRLPHTKSRETIAMRDESGPFRVSLVQFLDKRPSAEAAESVSH